MSDLKTQYYVQMKSPEDNSYGNLTNPWYNKDKAINFVKKHGDDKLDMRVVEVEREVILKK